MAKETVFGQAAGLSEAMTYDASKSEAEITEIIEQVEQFAEAGGIKVRIERNGRDVTYHFDNYADFLIVNEAFSPRALDPGEHRGHPGCQMFDDKNQEYRDTWTYYAHDYLDRLGVNYQTEENDRCVVFWFENYEAYVTFRAFQDAGYFDRRANARLGFAGPVEP